MELRNYLQVLWRRKWLIAFTTAVTVLVAAVGTSFMTPTYEASVTLRLVTATSGPIGRAEYELAYTDRLMNTYRRIATVQPVLDELQQRLAVSQLPEFDVEILANTELMRITAESSRPELAAEAANMLAEILVSEGRSLNSQGAEISREAVAEQLNEVEEQLGLARDEYEELVSQSPENTAAIAAAERELELQQETFRLLMEEYEQARARAVIGAPPLLVVEPATIPLEPASPNAPLIIALGLGVGLTAGLGLAFVFENLDDKLNTIEAIEDVVGLSAAARIPRAPQKSHVGYFNGLSPQGEALRHLRTRLFHRQRETPLKTLLVTSAEPGEGKSTVAASLALAVAKSGHRVIVVDGDLRRGRLHELFELPNEKGLSTLLSHSVSWSEAIQVGPEPGVWVLTSGPRPASPSELLDSPRLASVIEQLKEEFDLVLFDSPAMLAVTDPLVLAPLMDGVVLVVGRRQFRLEAVKAARRQLDGSEIEPLFLVVNWTEQDPRYDYYLSGNSLAEDGNPGEKDPSSEKG